MDPSHPLLNGPRRIVPAPATPPKDYKALYERALKRIEQLEKMLRQQSSAQAGVAQKTGAKGFGRGHRR